MKKVRVLHSLFQLREDDILRLIGRRSRREVDVVDDVLLFRQTQQVAVGNGRLAGARRPDEQDWFTLRHESLQEELLTLGVNGVDDKFVHLLRQHKQQVSVTHMRDVLDFFTKINLSVL